MLEHKPAKIAVIVATLVVFIATAVLNGLASQPEYSSGIFTTTPGNVSGEFMTEITPANWTFGIWGVIYFWMILGIIYCNAAIFIKRDNDYLYKHDAFMPISFFVLYIINLGLNITWLILFDRKFMIACFFVLLTMAVTAFICLILSIHAMSKRFNPVSRREFGIHFWLIEILVHNGIGCYAAWLTVATHLNLNIALEHVWNVKSSTIILIVLLIFGASWLSLDMIILGRHTRYLLTPYIVLTVALAGIVDKHVDFNDLERVAIFMLVILIIFSGSCLCKIVAMFWNHFRGPRSMRLV